MSVADKILNTSDIPVYRFKISSKEESKIEELTFNVSGRIEGKVLGQDQGGNEEDNPSTLNGFEGNVGLATASNEGSPSIHFSDAYLWNINESSKVEAEIYYGNSDKENGSVLVIKSNIEIKEKESEFELRGRIKGLKKENTDYLSFELAKNNLSNSKSQLNEASPPTVGKTLVWSQNGDDMNHNFLNELSGDKQKLYLQAKSERPKMSVSVSSNSTAEGILLSGQNDFMLGKFDIKNLDEKDIKINRFSAGLVLEPQYQYNDYLLNLGLYKSDEPYNAISTAGTYDNRVRFKDFELTIPAGGSTSLLIKADIPEIQGYIKSGTIFAPAVQYIQAYQGSKKIDGNEEQDLNCSSNFTFPNSISTIANVDNDCSELKIGNILLIGQEYIALINKLEDEDGKISYKLIRGLFGSPTEELKNINASEIKKLSAVGNILILKQSYPIITSTGGGSSLEPNKEQTIYKFRVNTKASKLVDKKYRKSSIARIVFKINGKIGGQVLSSQIGNFKLLADGKEQDIASNLVRDAKGQNYLIIDFERDKAIDEQGRIFELKAKIKTDLESGDFLEVNIPAIVKESSDKGIRKFIYSKLDNVIASVLPKKVLDDFIWSDRASGSQIFKYSSAQWSHGYLLDSLPTEAQQISYSGAAAPVVEESESVEVQSIEERVPVKRKPLRNL